MILFARKYGLTVEQVERLYQEGIISYKPLRDAEIVEHYEEVYKRTGSKMDSVYETIFLYDISISTFYRAMRMAAMPNHFLS